MGHAILGRGSITCFRGGFSPLHIILHDRQGNEYRCEWDQERFEMAKDDRSVPVQTPDGKKKNFLKSYLKFVKEYTPEEQTKLQDEKDERDEGGDSREHSDTEGPSEVDAAQPLIRARLREKTIPDETSAADVLEAAFDADG